MNEIPEEIKRDKETNKKKPFILGSKNRNTTEYRIRKAMMYSVNSFLLFFTGFIGGLQGLILSIQFEGFYLGLTKIVIISEVFCSLAYWRGVFPSLSLIFR